MRTSVFSAITYGVAMVAVLKRKNITQKTVTRAEKQYVFGVMLRLGTFTKRTLLDDFGIEDPTKREYFKHVVGSAVLQFVQNSAQEKYTHTRVREDGATVVEYTLRPQGRQVLKDLQNK
jgi:hypothetical protein